MPYTVPVSSVPLLQDPPFVLALLVLAAALGRRILLLVGARPERAPALEWGVLCAGVGLGAIQAMPFALGALGVLTPAGVWLALGLLAVALAHDAAAVARGVLLAARRRMRRRAPAWAVATACILAVPIGVALLQALCPPTAQDALGYHLTAPKRWLQAESLCYLPAIPHTNSPLGVEMLYTISLAVWSDTAAALIHFAFGALSMCALYALGRRLRGPAAGVAAAAAFALGVPRLWALPSFIVAYVDLAVVFETLCACLAWLHLRRDGDRGWLWCAGLCAGFAGSFKLTAAPLGVVLALLTAAVRLRASEPPSAAFREAAGLLGISLLPILPWLGRAWVLTGNPVWPMLSGLFPTRDWSSEAGAAYSAYFRYYNWAVRGADALPLAARRALLAGATLVTAAATALAVRVLSRPGERWLALLAGTMGIAGMAGTGLYLRLLMPWTTLAILLVAVAATRALARVPGAGVVALALLAVNAAVYVRGAGLPATAQAAVGAIDRHRFLGAAMPLTALWDYVNARLEPGARLLYAAPGGTYYSDRYCFMTDPYLQHRVRLDRWPAFVASMRRDGIRYAVLPEVTQDLERPGPPYAPARNEVRFVRRLVRAGGRRLTAVDRLGLYRIERWPARSGAAGGSAPEGAAP